MAYLNIGNSRYEIINNKPSTDYCISVHGNGLNGYCVLTKNKPGQNRDTIAVQTIDGIRYVNDPIKPMSKIKISRQMEADKGHDWYWARFYNNSEQLICTIKLWNGWWNAEGLIDSSLTDQSIKRCHLYYYQDTRSWGWCRLTCDVIDIDGQSHRLFMGRSFKNHGHDMNQYLGVGQRDNWRANENNNFPMELRY